MKKSFHPLSAIAFAAILLSLFVIPSELSAKNGRSRSSFSWIADSLKTIELLNVTVLDSANSTATVRIGFSNPGGPFEISEVEAGFAIDGKICFVAQTDNIIPVEKKCNKTYLVDVLLSIPSDANPITILNVLKSRNTPHMSLQVTFKLAMRGGAGIKLHQVIDLDNKIKIDTLKAQLYGKPFSIGRMSGKFIVNHFDILFIDEVGTDGFSALLEINLVAPTVMKACPEFHLYGDLRFSQEDMLQVGAAYKLDIKAGERMYYLPVNGKMFKSFNPFTLLNLLKENCNDTISIKLEKPIRGEFTLFGD